MNKRRLRWDIGTQSSDIIRRGWRWRRRSKGICKSAFPRCCHWSRIESFCVGSCWPVVCRASSRILSVLYVTSKTRFLLYWAGHQFCVPPNKLSIHKPPLMPRSWGEYQLPSKRQPCLLSLQYCLESNFFQFFSDSRCSTLL